MALASTPDSPTPRAEARGYGLRAVGGHRPAGHQAASMDLATIRKRLAQQARNEAGARETGAPETGLLPADFREPGRWGAVAAILMERANGVEILLIRRAQRPGDRWSGQVALPGGHAEPTDADLRATVVRETQEEVGFSLDEHGELIGRLPDLPVSARGRHTGMMVVPFVFALSSEPQLATNEEVDEVFWASLEKMVRGEIDTVMQYQLDGARFELPAYDVDGHIVWGLTYKILQNLLARLGINQG